MTEPTWRVIEGDCVRSMRKMRPGIFNTCVTSPPYFGLRDYGHDDQIGHERTVSEYVASMVRVFRAVHRVLRRDGTLWLNIGDSYSTSSKPDSVPPKNVFGVPWRVAFALQDDGWFLRQDIVWSKPNPMAESVKDRCTKSHEYVFLLSKSQRYFFDYESMQEPGVIPAGKRGGKGSAERSSCKTVNSRPARYWTYTGWRNRRSVWNVHVRPSKEAHFAVFPEKLVEPCILAGSPEGGLVLDPFGGTGTTGVVAMRHNRHSVILELNPEYAEMARRRIFRASGVGEFGGK